jgi:hypothetical protein
MPKVQYYYAIPVACIGYMLGYDVFGILIASIVIFGLWNFCVDVPENFGYVRKEEYLKLKREHEANKKQLLEFANYVLKMNEQRRSAGYKNYEWSKKSEENIYNTTRKSNSNNWRGALNVGLRATKVEVDAAYKTLVKKYHPDINKDPNAALRMQAINQAKGEADKFFATP